MTKMEDQDISVLKEVEVEGTSNASPVAAKEEEQVHTAYGSATEAEAAAVRRNGVPRA